MDVDPANASWHPALMPNVSQVLSEESASQQPNNSSPSSAETHSQLPRQTEMGLSQPSSLEEAKPVSELHSEIEHNVDDISSNGPHDDDGGACLGLESSAIQTKQVDLKTENDPSTDQIGASEPQSSREEELHGYIPPKPVNGAQHSSSMSFARTVSHDPSFNDDEETDWDTARTAESDSFAFMPPISRTNTFPAVPPRNAPSLIDDTVLPASQAEDLLNKSDYDDVTISEELEPHTIENSQVASDRHVSISSMGGDIQVVEAQLPESRYEEGIPLLASEAEPVVNTEEPLPDNILTTSFTDENDGEDDSWLGGAAAGDDISETEPVEASLRRKSTIQAMGSANVDASSQQSTANNVFVEESGEAPSGNNEKLGTTLNEDNTGEDLSAKWESAFGEEEDDDFLFENSAIDQQSDVDAAAFLGSDDEGFLDDDGFLPDDEPLSATTNAHSVKAPQAARTTSYIPQTASGPISAQTYQPLTISPTWPAPSNPYNGAPQMRDPSSLGQPGQAPVSPGAATMQSFSDKSKGGYSSPYDLPTDLITSTIKPRKRPTMQQHATAPASQPPALARSGSIPVGQPPNSVSLQGSHRTVSEMPASQKPAPPTLRKVGSNSSFFEDLPMANRSRPSSKHGNRVSSPVRQTPPTAALTGPPPRPVASQNIVPSPSSAALPNHHSPKEIGNLVAPQRVSPYAPLSTSPGSTPMSAPHTEASKYSSAPQVGPNQPAIAAPNANSRYSPAPNQVRSATYSPMGPFTQTTPVLAHQPRTSSPLTQFESHVTSHDGVVSERRASSSSHEPRFSRIPSLPPTREVAEENEQASTGRSLSASHASGGPTNPIPSRYSPTTAQSINRRTPPPQSPGSPVLSPPKRQNSNYAPTPTDTTRSAAGPLRSQTQSPGAIKSAQIGNARRPELNPRPTSSQSTALPTSGHTPHVPSALGARPRAQSGPKDYQAPTDGREQDPLQRWVGVPVITWGVGGTIATSFPASVPRYGMNQTTPTIIRTNGEVKIRNIRDVDPLQERLSRFPGPLKGKSKKKDTIVWLSAGIENLEREIPDVSFHSELSLEAKRTVERLLLWKILRVFVDNDGLLEGNATVEQAVREVLSPGKLESNSTHENTMLNSNGLPEQYSHTGSLQPDFADVGASEKIRNFLVKGERENAVWAAVDKRLWGHAMLISNTVSSDLYKQVAQEFVRKEVNYPGHRNESVAALYKILSGNFTDCVDELVPVHARAGMQLVSTGNTSGPTKDAVDGLDKWQETLALILSNRSPNDIQGLRALGDLLAGYGRAEAAHICYIFSRQVSTFGGVDDTNANIVLVGSDHRQQLDQFAKEVEALQLSEVYEYGLSLAGGITAAAGAPHLAAYKLEHAITLSEYGYRDKALQYCDAIVTSMTSQTKRSPYYHTVLEAAVLDLLTRLKQAPKGEASSWISKPSMGKVSDSMWNRFNKFVAGDDEKGLKADSGEGENGPFAHIASTPNLSRSPSVTNFDAYPGGSPGYSTSLQPPNAAPSRYAPTSNPVQTSASPYAPAAALTSSFAPPDYAYGQQEPAYSAFSNTPTVNGGLAPPAQLYGSAAVASDHTVKHGSRSYQPLGLQDSPDLQPSSGGARLSESPPQNYQPLSYGYDSPDRTNGDNQTQDAETKSDGEQNQGYEPPSFQPYGYEPPSYQPDNDEDQDEVKKPKKKSFMDDDDDDIPALKGKSNNKSNADRENEEMFRKAAEEDGEKYKMLINVHIANLNLQLNVVQHRSQAKRAGALADGLEERRLMLTSHRMRLRISLLRPS